MPEMADKVRTFLTGKKTTIAAGTLTASWYLMQGASALEINTTDVDQMFDAVNQHIIPKAGETISAMPGLIIPLAFLVVLLMIIFFVPNVLNGMLDVIKNAIRTKGK